MSFLLALVCCLNGEVPCVLDHELDVAQQKLAVLQKEVVQSDLQVRDAVMKSEERGATALAIAAAQLSDRVARLNAQIRYLKHLTGARRDSIAQTSGALVFAIPGFDSHPLLVPVSRLVIQGAASEWRVPDPTPVRSIGIKNSDAWRESLGRTQGVKEANKIRLDISIAQATENLAKLQRVSVWQSTGLSSQIALTGLQAGGRSATSGVGSAADIICEARRRLWLETLEFRASRGRFAQWRVANPTVDVNEFVWPPSTPREPLASPLNSSGGTIRVWGSPNEEQLESAVSAAGIRVEAAMNAEKRIRIRKTASPAKKKTSAADNSNDARLTAARYQLELRKSEYKLTLAIRNAYADPSAASHEKLRQRAVDVFSGHASAVALREVGRLETESRLRQVEICLKDYESGSGTWEAWTNARVGLNRSSTWKESLIARQHLATRQLAVLQQLASE